MAFFAAPRPAQQTWPDALTVSEGPQLEKGKVAPVCGLTAPNTIIGILGEKVGGIESIFPPSLPAAHTRIISYILMSSEIRYLSVSVE